MKILTTGSQKFYGQACAATRQQALDNMIIEAEKLGADGIIGVQFHTSPYYEHLTEVAVFGTAVKITE